MLIPLLGYSQNPEQNYIVSRIPKIPTADTVDLSRLMADQLSSSVEYFDGIGRKIQLVTIQASPALNDVIHSFQYDLAGRQLFDYLPFTIEQPKGDFIDDPLTKIIEFYNHPPENVTPTSIPYAEKKFDNSPLSQLIKQGAPGKTWEVEGTHSIVFSESSNSHPIPMWIVNHSGNCLHSGSYPAGSLWVSEKKDENGNKSRIYNTILGQTILKEQLLGDEWIKTFFVYDVFGDLRFVIPPEATAEMSANEALIFQYLYDRKHRIIEKRIPGMEVIYLVYDNLDRLILQQDGNLRRDTLWTYIKYDIFSRPLSTGKYKDLSSHEELQVMMALKSPEHEEFIDGKYTNPAFPSNNIIPLTYIYYDNFEFDGTDDLKFLQVYDPDPQPENVAEFLPAIDNTGKTTGTKLRITGTNEWLTSVFYYDKYSKPIQTVSENHMGGFDRTSNLYDFSGKLIETSHDHVTGKKDGNPKEVYL